MSLLTWESFYRQYVNRREASLISPRIFSIDQFRLPKGSVVHYLPVSNGDNGPSYNDPLFRGVSRLIGTWYVDKLSVMEGSIQPKSVVVSSEIRKYHLENKKIKRVFDLKSSLKDVESPLVVNYCHLEKKYKYLSSPLSRWHSFSNKLRTVCDEMEKIYRESPGSNQFLMIECPRVIPGYPYFLAVNKQENRTNVDRFDSFEKYVVLNIFNLFRDGSEGRCAFTEVSRSGLDKINVVFVDSGYFTVINLGTLMSWVKGVDHPTGKNPRIMRTYFVRFILALMKVRSEDIDELVEHGELVDQGKDSSSAVVIEDKTVDDGVTDSKSTKVDKTDSEDDDDEDDSGDEDSDIEEIAQSVKTLQVEKERYQQEKTEVIKDKSIRYDDEMEEMVFDDSILTEDEAKELALLEKQLSDEHVILEQAKQRKLIRKQDIPLSFDDVDIDPEERNSYRFDNLLDGGVISPREYDRLTELAGRYKKIVIDDKPLDEYVDVKQEEIQVRNVKVDDISQVSDKTMLSSTLLDFDAKYVSEVLDRDIAGMLVHAQKGGIMISDLTTTTTESTRGTMVHYDVEITPVKGKKSHLKFTLPKIREDGTYLSNGTAYRLRKQKTDIPIRKISSTRVALTSAYGKLFIERAEDSKFNYPKWLTKQIRSRGLDKNNPRITETRTADVYDRSLKLPYLYSTLAKDFRTFQCNDDKLGSLYFYLDYHKRYAKLKDLHPNLALIEQSGQYVLVGYQYYQGSQYPLCIDYQDNLYVYQNGRYIPLPAIEDLIGIDVSKDLKKSVPVPPLSCLKTEVMGNVISVGVVLGYQLGFTNLLKLLNIDYHETEDTQALPKVGEYAITFKDKKYFFSRKDQLAASILNGFNLYAETLKDFDSYHFDQKDVYSVIYDNMRTASAIFKEVDLLFDLFVDPITYRILEDLSLPKTFRGLLFKAAELLLYDDAPKETDASLQRIRSYERIPALIYKKTVDLLRQHHRSGSEMNRGITINPNDILLSFLEDPANVAVNGLNPFQNMRQIEAVTYTGTGGRSKDTLKSKAMRAFDVHDVGTISEATVDSGDVGINIYTTANPNFKNVYGLSDPNHSPTVASMMSSVFNTMPCIEKDDEQIFLDFK